MNFNKLSSGLVKWGHGGGLGGTEDFTSAHSEAVDLGKQVAVGAPLQCNVADSL